MQSFGYVGFSSYVGRTISIINITDRYINFEEGIYDQFNGFYMFSADKNSLSSFTTTLHHPTTNIHFKWDRVADRSGFFRSIYFGLFENNIGSISFYK